MEFCVIEEMRMQHFLFLVVYLPLFIFSYYLMRDHELAKKKRKFDMDDNLLFKSYIGIIYAEYSSKWYFNAMILAYQYYNELELR